MIQPQELRIGNYVDVLGKIDQVKSIDENEHGGFCKFKENPYQYYLIHNGEEIVKPIPLTEEILLKFGFEKKSGSEFKNERFIYRFKQRDLIIEGFEYDYNGILCYPEFVHQLQNIYFALTEEELTF